MTDPRFDPAFQRGYSGPEPELVARRTPEVDPALDPAAAGPTPEGSTAAAIVAQSPDPDPDPDPQHEPAPDSDAPAAPRRLNPYRLALLIGGLLLLAAAVSMLYEAVQHPQGTSTTIDSQFLNLLVGNLPPALALAGFICLIAWIALGALDRGAAELDRHVL